MCSVNSVFHSRVPNLPRACQFSTLVVPTLFTGRTHMMAWTNTGSWSRRRASARRKPATKRSIRRQPRWGWNTVWFQTAPECPGQAEGDPTWQHAAQFSGLGDVQKRAERESAVQLEDPTSNNKFSQAWHSTCMHVHRPETNPCQHFFVGFD